MTLIVSACHTTAELAVGGKGRGVYKAIASNAVFQSHHTGFALYDPASELWLCRHNAEKYFTPASNAKIFTLLTCLHVLGDSVETLRYHIGQDSLFFTGMGDPAFLNPILSSSRRPFDLLQGFEGTLVYVPAEEIRPYGTGWAWDDYAYPYQAERSLLPVYGNKVTIIAHRADERQVIPAYFNDYMQEDETLKNKVHRDPVANAFAINPQNLRADDTLRIPFVTSDYELTRILADTLHKTVSLSYLPADVHAMLRVYGPATDTLLKSMLHGSDNLIAEQLLMQCAFFMRGTFRADSAIAVSQRMIISGAPDRVFWVDGSGLSRYNLMTPGSVVWALDQVRKMRTWEDIMDLFPAGGRSGTIAGWYGGEPPYVFAKTGTLRNQHCLSGYLRTASGRWLVFSFMHNNVSADLNDVRREMERILLRIHEMY